MSINKILKHICTYALILCFVMIGSSQVASTRVSSRLKIALSKGCGSDNYLAYAKWLQNNNPNVVCIDLYFINREQAIRTLDSVDGIVLTGGPDVEPARFGKPGDSSRCEIDLKRDTLEFELIKIAMQKKLPIIAVCRGEQIFNVANNGTLIIDIPTDRKTDIFHRCPNPDTCFHSISIIKNTLLYSLTKSEEGIVNTNHHQAVDILDPIFKVSAMSKDSIIEAYEWARPEGKQFFLAVQWHPERLDFNSPFSKPIAEKFLTEARKFKKLNLQRFK
jgi:putative glutamine amidotransferase